MRVLLADDHPIVLSGLEALLGRRSGLQLVGLARNGADALNDVQRLQPDIAVLDINMPKLTGLQVLDLIEAEGLSTRVILLTASATDAQIMGAVSKGVWGIMLKDNAAETLIECIEKVSSGERWLPPELVGPAFERQDSRPNSSSAFESLTRREQEIAMLVADGLSNKHIARRFNISEGTVKIHLHNAYRKLGVSNRTSLAMLCKNGEAPISRRPDFS